MIISSKTLAEDDVSEAFDSILQIGHRFLNNEVPQEFKSNRSKMWVWWKAPKKLGQNEDWEACERSLQIGHLFGPNGDQRDFYRKGYKLALSWQARKTS